MSDNNVLWPSPLTKSVDYVITHNSHHDYSLYLFNKLLKKFEKTLEQFKLSLWIQILQEDNYLF